jgi:hypothetical protein
MSQRNNWQISATGRLNQNSALRVARKMSGAWLIAFPTTCLIGQWLINKQVLEKIILADYFFIAFGNLLIGYAALLPLLRIGKKRPEVWSLEEGQNADQAETVSLLLGGTTIRFVGTIALVVLCRYHISSPDRTIALATIFWFALLTLVSVSSTSGEATRSK